MKLIVGVLVVGLLTAFMLPTVITSMSANENRAFNQSAGETVNVAPNLNATLDSTGDTSITVTLNDTAENTQNSITVSEGTNETVSMPDGDVIVSNDESNNVTAQVGYEYPKDYGWGDGTASLWSIIPIFFVLGILLFVVQKVK